MTQVPFVQQKDKIKAIADQIFQEVVDIRRDLHQHPELSGEEFRTAKIVGDYLEALGLEVKRGIAKTGVVAHLVGGKVTDRSKVIAFRADMDALPMNEENEHGYCSLSPNKMHACGHDAHTAILLGAAKILASLRSELEGTIKFVFQPSEEIAPGGAKPMLDEGIFEDRKPDVVYGLHCFPQLPVGTIGFCPGPMMAAADELYFTIKGKGGHASAPHRAIDPIVAAAQVIMNLQTVVSRNFPPFEPAVLTIGAIHGGTATNVIPNEVKMLGTFRTMNEELRFKGHQRIEEIVHSTANALGCTAELEIRKGFPAVINDPAMTHFAIAASEEYLGEQNTLRPDPVMAAEDFSYFLQACPGSYWQLGVSNESKGIVHNFHNTRFDIDEEALRVGSGFISYVAYKFLAVEGANKPEEAVSKFGGK
ncbi:MAG: amidohydrolase [Chlorobiales bacterium]|nr:amidohydrolase [Chlorobiales bacterium]